MSVRTLIIPTRFTAEDQLTPAQVKMGASAERFALKAEAAMGRAERAFKKLTPALGSAAKQLLSMVGTAALVTAAFTVGRYSVKSVMDYETAMHSLQAVTNVTDAEMVGFKKEINDLAKSSKKSSTEVAGSFETIGSAMSQYLEDPKGLRQIAAAGITLSKAARTELQPTLEDLTSIMNQFGLKAEDAAKSVDTLTAGEIVGSIRTSEAAGYLKDFGATAKNMNVDLAESTALIEALGVQMSKDKIGTGARNLLTIISAAGGLDKKARADLKGAGVDMKLLMDNTQSLSVRLHELSKIAKDPIKMVSVFGKENLTAGQVIFNQLATYDKFVAKIRTTSEAENQAKTNSNTLSVAIDELKAAWANMLTSSDGATEGLERAKSAIRFVTENLGTIVSVGIQVVKYYALIKGALLAGRAAMIAYNVVLGINNALKLKSLTLLEGNMVATRASIVTEKLMVAQMWLSKAATSAWSAVTAIATGDMIALNAAMAANPIGIVVVAVAALAAGIGYLVYQNQALREEYERDLNARIIKSLDQETASVERLAQRYIKLGMSKEEAIKKSIAFERESIGLEKVRLSGEINSLKAQLKDKEMMVMGGIINLPGHDEIQGKINAKQKGMTDLSAQSLALTNYAISKTAVDEERKQKMDLSNTKITAAETLNTFSSTKEAAVNSVNTINNSEASATLTIKNDSNVPVDVSDGKTRSFSVMPNMSSTMSTKKK